MELKIVVDGLSAALANISEQLAELNVSSVVQQNELLGKIDALMTDVEDIDAKLDAVHTMLSHLADTQAAHGVQLNAIMAALYAHK